MMVELLLSLVVTQPAFDQVQRELAFVSRIRADGPGFANDPAERWLVTRWLRGGRHARLFSGGVVTCGQCVETNPRRSHRSLQSTGASSCTGTFYRR
jgi:hypothetical protein